MPLKSFDFLMRFRHEAATSRASSILSWRNPLTLSIPLDGRGRVLNLPARSQSNGQNLQQDTSMSGGWLGRTAILLLMALVTATLPAPTALAAN